nr:LP06920p [Drosophila melanogaster]
MALQAAAVFAAGVRHKLSTSTLTKRSKMMMPTPLPSPTASMDHGAWETDMEFMYSRESKEEADETLSLGSTVTNSTATLGSISSTGSSVTGQPKDTPKDLPADQQPSVVVHPILRNICIFYSQKDPKKYSAIFYDYHLSLVHQRFMTRIRRPAPPPPAQLATSNTTSLAPRSDDSGCSCEAEDSYNHQHNPTPAIPKPLKEEWERAVLAAGAVAGKRGVAPRTGRKLRVRSNARLLLTDSVLAWRETLQDVNCCEDEEDMIVPVTDILRAQQIQEDNEVQQTQQSTILQRYKSVSIGNLLDLPGEDDKKSIKNRMRMKFAVNSNVFRINRSPKSEKKSRSRRGQVNSLYLDEQKYPLFAAPLSALELNMTDHPNVPRFVVDVCAYIEQPECIEQDGLYRASGNKVLVDELRKKLTHVYDPRWLKTDDIHTLTSLHKQFFRELTSPLITQEAYERLGRSLNDDAAIERMSLAFDDMPEPNRSTLRFLIRHLTRVAAASASNRMPSTNLAIVWGPCLLSANQIQLDIGRMNMLAKVLIENYDRIFHPDNERLVC